MSWHRKSIIQSWAGDSTISDDPLIRGYQYLNAVGQLALDPSMVEITDNVKERDRIYTWIGNHIDAINGELQTCLDACHSCYHDSLCRPMRILASPLGEKFGIDGFCNILATPAVILIDVGRIARSDWLSIVVHEYAHAHLGAPGHDQRFFDVISHLCLGLGLKPPRWQLDLETYLRDWPECPSKTNPLSFWMGYGCT